MTGTSAKCDSGNEIPNSRAKTISRDAAVSGEDTAKSDESFGAGNLELQSEGHFAEVPTDNQTVFSKSVHGAKWITILMICQRFINLIALVTLARLLTPEMYGAMIATNIIVGGVGVFLEPGFGALLVQGQNEVEKHLNAIWTLEVVKGVFLFLLISALSPLITRFFKIDGYEIVVCFGGLYLLIAGFKNVGINYLVKEMNFKKLFVQDLSKQLVYLICALIWVFTVGPSVWVLVAGSLGEYLIGTIITYFIHPYRPKLDFGFNKLKNLLHKTKWLIGSNIVNYLSGVVDTTFLGYLLGPSSMAIYSKARDISSVPSSFMSQITAKAGFPAVAQVQNETDKIKQGFIAMMEITLLISTPFLLVLIFEADRLVPLFLGEQWISMVMPLKLLAIAMTIRGIINITTPIFYGVGKFDMRFKTIVLQLVTTAGFLIYTIPKFGVEGAAYALIASSAIVCLYSIVKIIFLIRVNLLKVFPAVLMIAMSALITIALAYPFHKTIEGINGIIYLAILTGFGFVYALIFLLFGYITKKGPYKIVVDAVKVLVK